MSYFSSQLGLSPDQASLPGHLHLPSEVPHSVGKDSKPGFPRHPQGLVRPPKGKREGQKMLEDLLQRREASKGGDFQPLWRER